MRARRRAFIAAGSLVAATLVQLPVATAPASAASAARAADVEYEVLSLQTVDPLGLAVAPDGRVIWTEREGRLQVLKPDGTQVTAAQVPVSAGAFGQAPCATTCGELEAEPLEEGGLYAVLLAKDFMKTGRLYLYRSVPNSRDPRTGMGVWRLSTFVLDPKTNRLDLGSEKKLLEVGVDWDNCCHYGGDLSYLPDGTILLTTGDDVPATASEGYGPRDTTARHLNAELGVQNPADRRGKILRLMPDGSVPDGRQRGIRANPFLGKSGYNPYIVRNPDFPKKSPFAYVAGRGGSRAAHTIPFDPYVYALGFKQPFRSAVNPRTGTAYFSDVGPDASADDPFKGPKGYDERNAVPLGGGTNHGWPRCVANNKAYGDYDWAKSEFLGTMLDCSRMTPAPFYYPHDESKEFPAVGAGGTTGLPVAVYPEKPKGSLALPARFRGKLIDLERSRGWLATFPLRKDGSIDAKGFTIQTPFRSSVAGVDGSDVCSPVTVPVAGRRPCATGTLSSPMNAKVGPDGALYVVEYGTGVYDAVGGRIGRLKCAGCQPTSSDYAGQPRVATAALPAAPGGPTGGGPSLPVRDLATLLLVGLAVLALARTPRRRAVWA